MMLQTNLFPEAVYLTAVTKKNFFFVVLKIILNNSLVLIPFVFLSDNICIKIELYMLHAEMNIHQL